MEFEKVELVLTALSIDVSAKKDKTLNVSSFTPIITTVICPLKMTFLML